MRIQSLALLLALSSPAIAEKPAAADESALDREDRYVQVCQAAMQSKQAAKETAIRLDIGRRELSRIRCNEMSVMEFAKLHTIDPEEWTIATVQ